MHFDLFRVETRPFGCLWGNFSAGSQLVERWDSWVGGALTERNEFAFGSRTADGYIGRVKYGPGAVRGLVGSSANYVHYLITRQAAHLPTQKMEINLYNHFGLKEITCVIERKLNRKYIFAIGPTGNLRWIYVLSQTWGGCRGAITPAGQEVRNGAARSRT